MFQENFREIKIQQNFRTFLDACQSTLQKFISEVQEYIVDRQQQLMFAYSSYTAYIIHHNLLSLLLCNCQVSQHCHRMATLNSPLNRSHDCCSYFEFSIQNSFDWIKKLNGYITCRSLLSDFPNISAKQTISLNFVFAETKYKRLQYFVFISIVQDLKLSKRL